MAGIVADGFDDYLTTSFISQRWNNGTGNVNNTNLSGVTVDTTASRFTGGNGLHYTNNGTISAAFGNKTTLFFSCAFQLVAQSTPGQLLANFIDGSTSQVAFQLDSSNRINILVGGVNKGTSAAFTVLTWHRFEFKVTIDPSAGFAECKIDGVSAISFTGNTRVTANSFCNSFNFGAQAGTGFTAYWDDIILYDDTGSAPNGYLGDQRILTLQPNANGTLNQYTQNAAAWAASTVMNLGQQILDSNGNIQEVTSVTSDQKTGSGSHPTWSTTGGATTTDNHVTWTVRGTGLNPGSVDWMYVSEETPDGDNSYLSDSTVSDQERFTYPAISGNTVTAVVVAIDARKDDAGTRSLRAVTKSGATVADNGVDFPMVTNYADYEGWFPTDPNTSAAWTVSGVNAAEFGVKTTA